MLINMMGVKIAALVLNAFWLPITTAQNPQYSLFYNAEAERITAGPLANFGVQIFSGTYQTCMNYCSTFAECLGTAIDTYAPGQVWCVAFRYDPEGFTLIPSGYEYLAWRFDTPSGPACRYGQQDSYNIDGQCVCAGDSLQDTPFGCTAAVVPPSQAARRKLLTRNKIEPGLVKRPSFA